MGFLSPEKSGFHILKLQKFLKVFHMTLWPEWEPFVQRGPGLTGLRVMDGHARDWGWWEGDIDGNISDEKKTTQLPKAPPSPDAGHHLYSSGWITALSCQGGTSSSPSDLVCLRFLLEIFLLAPQLLFPYIGQDSASCPRVSMGIPTLTMFCPLRAAQPFLPHPHNTSSSLPWMVLPEVSFFCEVQSLDTSHPMSASSAGKRKEDLEKHN